MYVLSALPFCVVAWAALGSLGGVLGAAHVVFPALGTAAAAGVQRTAPGGFACATFGRGREKTLIYGASFVGAFFVGAFMFKVVVGGAGFLRSDFLSSG